MDDVSLASAFIGARTGEVQLAVAAKMLRMSADNAASVVKLIDAAQQSMERRHFLPARYAPGGPQVEQHRAAAPVRELLLGAGAVLEGKIGHPQRLARDRHGSDLATRQGRHALGGFDRRAAAGVGSPIA